VIVNLAAVDDMLIRAGQPPLQPRQWWLRTSGAAAPRGLPPGASVVSLEQAAHALLTDPLPSVPQLSLIIIAVTAGVLAAIGFAVSVAASVRERRAQTALLAALGVTRTAEAGRLCLEQLMLSAPAAAAGALIGTGLAYMLVPAVTLTGAAAVPFPPPLVLVPVGWVIVVALAVAVAPVLAAAATAGYRPDPAAELRVAEAE
jgi:predicted lysophospholipase L1 biosynthesis ABC-type transport system permease subunit